MTDGTPSSQTYLVDEVGNRRLEVREYLQSARPGAVRLTSTSIICSAMAAALTAGPALGGQSFAQAIQHALGLPESSTVWRLLCFGAVVVSVLAAISTGLLKSSDTTAHIATAEIAKGKLDGLFIRLKFEGNAEHAPEELAEIIATVPFIDERKSSRRRWLLVGGSGVVIILLALFALSLQSHPTQPGAVKTTTTSSSPIARSTSGPTPSPEATGVYSGRTATATIGISIIVDAGRATAYVCDGQRLEVWLKGTAEGNRLTMTGKTGTSFSGVIQGQSLSGAVNTPTSRLEILATSSAPPAGVYRANIKLNNQDAVIGWAVLSDGTQLGVVDVAGSLTPAPYLTFTSPDCPVFTLNGESHPACRVTP